MENTKDVDVVIIGGSYAGLSAGMALGRALRRVLIVDGGEPCNRQTPQSHNFITHDGTKPAEIAAIARQQVLRYKTVRLMNGFVNVVTRNGNSFNVKIGGDQYQAKKIILATGLKDVMADIEGFAACWGISVLHCPYCHGYEVRHEKTGILANGPMAFEYAKLISNWTNDLTLFTNGPATLTPEQHEQIVQHHISVVETPLKRIEHHDGYLHHLVMADNTRIPCKAVYAAIPKEQSPIVAQLGCELHEQGGIRIDTMQRTSAAGVLACGDNSTMGRSVALAVASGNIAGAVANKDIIEEAFVPA